MLRFQSLTSAHYCHQGTDQRTDSLQMSCCHKAIHHRASHHRASQHRAIHQDAICLRTHQESPQNSILIELRTLSLSSSSHNHPPWLRHGPSNPPNVVYLLRRYNMAWTSSSIKSTWSIPHYWECPSSVPGSISTTPNRLHQSIRMRDTASKTFVAMRPTDLRQHPTQAVLVTRHLTLMSSAKEQVIPQTILNQSINNSSTNETPLGESNFDSGVSSIHAT